MEKVGLTLKVFPHSELTQGLLNFFDLSQILAHSPPSALTLSKSRNWSVIYVWWA
jgi:hypothetical protein